MGENRKGTMLKIYRILKTFDARRLHRVCMMLEGMKAAGEQEIEDIRVFSQHYVRH